MCFQTGPNDDNIRTAGVNRRLVTAQSAFLIYDWFFSLGQSTDHCSRAISGVFSQSEFEHK